MKYVVEAGNKLIIIGISLVIISLIYYCSASSALTIFASGEKFANTGFETDLTGWTAGRWWLSGGVNSSNAIAAYQPRGSSSLSASYTNLTNSGTYDAAPGTSPTWNTSNGWMFDSTQYLSTNGISCSSTWSMIIRYSNAADLNQKRIGGSNNFFFTPVANSSTAVRFTNGGTVDNAPKMLSGILAMAGKRSFRNGTYIGDTSGQTGSGVVYMNSNIAFTRNSVYIQSFAIYDTTLTDEQISTLTTSMNGMGIFTQDTGTKYSGSASAKIIADTEASPFVQSVNVGDSNTYNISAYAYTDGSEVTSSDLELYYNYSTVTTTYVSVGSGWYKLTGTATGANELRDYGVSVKGGKTVYVDDVSLSLMPISATSSSSSSSSGVSYIQIPEITSPIFNPIVVSPIIDSNTKGQGVMTIIQPQTFVFNGFLSANQVSPSTLVSGVTFTPSGIPQLPTTTSVVKPNIVVSGGGAGTLLGVKSQGVTLWQVGGIQEVWYKGYPAQGTAAAKILPHLQTKPSIIVLGYNDSYLIPPGAPNTKFTETKLKLAHSLDGRSWTILTSVVDPINNTVATIGKVGGYYMIVGRY